MVGRFPPASSAPKDTVGPAVDSARFTAVNSAGRESAGNEFRPSLFRPIRVPVTSADEPRLASPVFQRDSRRSNYPSILNDDEDDKRKDSFKPEPRSPPPILSPDEVARSAISEMGRYRQHSRGPSPMDIDNTESLDSTSGMHIHSQTSTSAFQRPRSNVSPQWSPEQRPPVDSGERSRSPSPGQADNSPGLSDYHDEHGMKKRKFSTRSKTGCATCRRRKKKCDEGKPFCANCTKGSFLCEGYGDKTIVRTPTTSNNRRAVDIAVRRKDTVASGAKYEDPQRPSRPSLSDASLSAAQSASPLPNRNASGGWMAAPSPTEPVVRPSSPPTILPPTNTFQPRVSPPSQVGQYGIERAVPATRHLDISRIQDKLHGPMEMSHDQDRNRMVSGQSYRHYASSTLLLDRQDCKKALFRYHEAMKPFPSVAGDAEGLLKAILFPSLRRDARGKPDLKGNIGQRSIIEPPFTCDYGYNIHIGADVIIQPDCQISDPCRIDIGDRTIIGLNVKFRGMSFDHTPQSSAVGHSSLAVGKPIKIGRDCKIGNDVVVAGGVTIGDGSVIEAGSFVTKDLRPYELCGGNPADFIRSLRPHDVVRP